jgi:hypothetical protein
MAGRIALLFVCLAASGQTLDEAVASLAKRVSARLAAAETARVTSRNISSLPAAEASKAQPALTRALQRRVRNPKQVEVALTISENARSFVLVAEIRRENETAVEMADFVVTPPAPAPRPAVSLKSNRLFELEDPILDVLSSSNGTLVLDPAGLLRLSGGKWERVGVFTDPVSVRDPRGRLEANQDTVTIHIPGATCSIAEALLCKEGGRFREGRNTQDLDDWRGEFFTSAEIGGEILVAGTDGRVRVYDGMHALQSAFDGWGSDFVTLGGCGGSHVAATSTSTPDSVTLYDLVNRAPMAISEPLEFSGPITALWPAGEGALAVARDSASGIYAAYSLTLDCGR